MSNLNRNSNLSSFLPSVPAWDESVLVLDYASSSNPSAFLKTAIICVRCQTIQTIQLQTYWCSSFLAALITFIVHSQEQKHCRTQHCKVQCEFAYFKHKWDETDQNMSEEMTPKRTAAADNFFFQEFE